MDIKEFEGLNYADGVWSARTRLPAALAAADNEVRKSLGRIITLAVVLLGLIIVWGCSMASYGSLKRSPDVAHIFETDQLWPDHRYYYLNQENNPFAVVALQSSYTLKGLNWTEVDAQSAKLKKVVGLVESFPVSYSYTYGAYVMDAGGNAIGYWYSSLPLVSIKVDSETKTVWIRTETPWLWDDRGGPSTDVGREIGPGG
ncbi:MAG: hypothetical protein JSW39_02665 [Desulfobacterales bacterium]|nr:MAG: hypothetical protein JSW39_02665 [Desulfobacterales bacterium]